MTVMLILAAPFVLTALVLLFIFGRTLLRVYRARRAEWPHPPLDGYQPQSRDVLRYKGHVPPRPLPPPMEP
jgi:hypothetical protein